MPQFNQETNQFLGIQERPSRARSNSGSRLQNLDSGLREAPNDLIHIIHFEEDVVDTATLLFQKLTIGISLAFDRLDEFQFQRTDLDECVPNPNVLVFTAVEVLGIWAIRPFDETERANAKQGSQQPRCALEIPNDNTNLDRALQFNRRDRTMQFIHC